MNRQSHRGWLGIVLPIVALAAVGCSTQSSSPQVISLSNADGSTTHLRISPVTRTDSAAATKYQFKLSQLDDPSRSDIEVIAELDNGSQTDSVQGALRVNRDGRTAVMSFQRTGDVVEAGLERAQYGRSFRGYNSSETIARSDYMTTPAVNATGAWPFHGDHRFAMEAVRVLGGANADLAVFGDAMLAGADSISRQYGVDDKHLADFFEAVQVAATADPPDWRACDSEDTRNRGAEGNIGKVGPVAITTGLTIKVAAGAYAKGTSACPKMGGGNPTYPSAGSGNFNTGQCTDADKPIAGCKKDAWYGQIKLDAYIAMDNGTNTGCDANEMDDFAYVGYILFNDTELTAQGQKTDVACHGIICAYGAGDFNIIFGKSDAGWTFGIKNEVKGAAAGGNTVDGRKECDTLKAKVGVGGGGEERAAGSSSASGI